MKHIFLILALVPILHLVTGCNSIHPDPISGSGITMTSDYQEQPTLTTSLFKSDQNVLGEDEISKIMSSKVNLPTKAKIALMRFDHQQGGVFRSYGYHFWRSEAYLKTQQEYIDSLAQVLGDSDRVADVTIMPSLLIPKDATVPLLREAAVRLQADLILIFRIASDTYYKSKFLSPDDVKAYCTSEIVLLDVRTGTIPFTTIVTKERLEQKNRADLESEETMRRAEKLAVLNSLDAVGIQLSAFLQAAH